MNPVRNCVIPDVVGDGVYALDKEIQVGVARIVQSPSS